MTTSGTMAPGGTSEMDDGEIEIRGIRSVAGGEPRSGQLTGTKALMLAVLEDGIRSYLGGSRVIAQDAEYWILSSRGRSPFSFVVICEILGLNPEAVRQTLRQMKLQNVSPRKAIPRSRHNVRIPGRVHARRAH